MSKHVSVTKHDGVATVVIDNPPMNVLSNQVLTGLDDVFGQLETDDEVITIILTGAGDRAFMAGADIKEFLDEDVNQEAKDTHGVLNRIAAIPKPTIVLLNGFTLGGGLELALTCDLRIAEDHVQIGLPEVNLGLLPGGGGTQRLPKEIGIAKAKELMFTGSHISADEAYNIGIVNQVVKKSEGKEAANQLAHKVAGNSLQSLSRIKQLINNTEQVSLHEGLQQEKAAFKALFATQDSQEGIQAFIEKRKPEFNHR
ncbi:enoyl-CoA hydratase [Barrientosiimonas marina]|uniref:Enoyl-CoA hydratase/isomerase family protein n=1 Tax=Lentibacillus kimchii TaxID=1542911 RepID=A0ABW2UV10_9BACI